MDSARWLIRVSTIQRTDIRDWPHYYIYLGGESIGCAKSCRTDQNTKNRESRFFHLNFTLNDLNIAPSMRCTSYYTGPLGLPNSHKANTIKKAKNF
jgi:hypothetical protein